MPEMRSSSFLLVRMDFLSHEKQKVHQALYSDCIAMISDLSGANDCH
jgi:hypothetical protein